MKILLASPRGFCAGVTMAVQALDEALALFGPPIYVYHEIVHNKHIVERFRKQGVVFVEDLADVPPGSRLIYSAHGVSPEVRRAGREQRLKTIDATCPLVRKVHLEAVRFARAGYSIVLIGHAGHDEVAGVLGEAPEQITLVENIDDVDRLNLPDPGKVAYLTQTTLSVDEAQLIVERLKARYPQCVGPPKDDICYATQNRQDALKELLDESDFVLVVGSQNSSNSSRLAEIAAGRGKRAYLVDGPNEIRLEWFTGDEVVLLTAGASAPEDLVQGCIAFLQEHFDVAVEVRQSRTEQVFFPLPLELGGSVRDHTPALH